MNERKPEHITFRVSAEFKALLRQQASQQNRSITSYLEWLVMQDAARTEPKNRRGNVPVDGMKRQKVEC